MASTDGALSAKKVYYASYGSNLHCDRLLAYIVGGTVDGAAGCQFGCSDKASPSHSFVALAPGFLRFGRTSRKWGGGGVCFFKPKSDEDAAAAAVLSESATSISGSSVTATTSTSSASELLVRTWCMSRRQFLDIFLQENSLDPAADGHRATEAHLETLLASGPGSGLAVGRGWYSYMWYIGDAPDGLPVVTCTAPPESWSDPATRDAMKHNPPSLAYARVIFRGLKECGLDDAAAVWYLSDRAQIELDAAALAADAAALADALPVERAGAASASASLTEHMAVGGAAAVTVAPATGGAGATLVSLSGGSSSGCPPFLRLTLKR